MADERIDILIEARENVRGAVASALASLGALNVASKESDANMRSLGDSTEYASDKISRRFQRALVESQKAVREETRDVDRLVASHDRMGRSVDDAAKNLEHAQQVTHDYRRDLRTTENQLRDTNAQIDEHNKRLEKLTSGSKAYREEKAQVDALEKSLKKLGDRYDEQVKKYDSSAKAAERYSAAVREQAQHHSDAERLLNREGEALRRNTEQYERSTRQVVATQREITRAQEQGAAIRTARLRKELQDQQREREQFAQRARQAQEDIIKIKMELDTRGIDRELAEKEAQLDVFGRDRTIHFDVDIDDMMAELAEAEVIADAATRDRTIHVDVDSGGALNALNSINKAIQDNRHSIAQFDNQIRGMLAFLAVGLAQPLITTLVALAGELVAVGSSAIMAGGAIGVGLTSGIAQALPVVGLLVGAFTRVAAVMEAVQQHTLMLKQNSAQQQQGTEDNTSATNTLAGAMDGLKSAQQGVIDAQDRLAEAQQNLTRARFEARRELQDLILAEKDAQLAAQGAALSQEEAQRALQRAVATGDVAGVSSATLDVQQAATDRRRAELEARRASQDLRFQRQGSPLAPDQSVEEAQKQVEDAQQGIADAQQQVVAARRAIDSANASLQQNNQDMVAAAANLQFFLSRLSDAEKELYHAILNIRRTFTHEWSGITDSIVSSMAFAVNRVNQMMKDPEIIRSAKRLADSISENMDRVTREFTGEKFSEFWQTMAGAASRNLRPITRDFLTLSNTFRRIADAGRPLFREMIQLIHEAVQDFDHFVGRGKDLRDFFDEMGKHLEAWWNLGRAVLRLFVVLIGSSAKEGLNSVRDVTKAINEAASWIEDHGKKMDQFWRGTRRVMEELARVIGALGEEIFKSFSPRSVEALGQVIRRIFIPALGSAIRFMGQMFIYMEKLSKNDTVAFLLKFAIGASIAAKVLKTLGGLFLSLFGGILRAGSAITTVIGGFQKFGNFLTRTIPLLAQFVGEMGGWRVFLLRLAGPIGIIAGLLVYLLDKFGLLDDIWEAIKRGVQIVVRAVKPSVEDLMDAFERLSKALSGDGGGLGAVLKFVFTTVVKGLVIPAIKILAHIVGDTLGGAFDVLAGVINVIADVLMGKWDKIPGHLKDIFGGVARIVTAPFNAISDFLDNKMGVIGDIILAPFRMVKSVLGNFGDFLIDTIGGAIGVVNDLIHGRFDDAWSGLKDVLLAPFRAFKNVLEDLFNIIIDIINPVLDAIGIGTIGDVGGEDVPDVTGRQSQRGLAGERNTRRRHLGAATGGRIGLAGGGIPGGIVGFGLSQTPLGPLGGLLGGGIADLVSKALDKLPDPGGFASKLSGVFKQAPGAIIGSVRDWLIDQAGGAVGDFFGGVGDFFGGIFAGGGHVPGPGGVDVIPANLTRGEFVVTPHGERLLESVTGVPGILNWLGRRQRPAQGFATGGRAGGGSGADAVGGDPTADVNVGDLADSVKKIIQALRRFSKNGADEWNDAWDRIQDRTRRGSRQIGNLFDRLGKDVSDSIDKLTDSVEKDFDQMVNRVVRDLVRMSKAAKTEGKDFTDFIKDSMDAADSATYKGLSYIVDAVNKGLKAFDEKPIDISVSRPQTGGKASGGFVGQPGERGADSELTLLGRGEAVLNWAHQKVVDPAMRAVYGFGLSEMFDKTSAMHGKAAPGGYASGGYTGPGGSGAGFTPVWNLAQSKFGMTGYTGFEGHSMMTTSGNISDHYLHRALDMSDGGILTPAMDALNNFFKTKVPQIVKQLIWRGVDQFNGYPIGDHTDHVHLAMPDQYAFNETVTAKILSAAQKGLDFSSLLKGGGESGVQLWKNIPEVIAKGTDGPMLDIVNSALSKVREAANKYGQSIAEKMGGDLLGTPSASGPTPKGGWYKVGATWEGLDGALGSAGVPVGKGWAELLVAGANAGLISESVSSLLGIAPGSKGAQYGAPDFTKIYVRRPGTMHPIAIEKTDVGSGQAGDPYYKVDLQSQPAEALGGKITQDIEIHKYAKGGIAGHGAAPGTEIPIIAHAGEWILNARQQSRLEQITGIPARIIQGLLGFGGGPSHFQDGGEVKETGVHFFDQFIENFMKQFRKLFGREPTLMTGQFGNFAATLGATQLAIRDWLEQLTGGEPRNLSMPEGNRPRRRRRGAEDDEERAVREAFDTMRGVSRIISNIAKTFKDSGKNLNDDIRNAFEGLTGDGGVLDRLGEQFDEMVTIMESQITKMQVAVRKHGARVTGRAAFGIRVMEENIDNLQEQLRLLIGERGVLNDAMKKAQKALEVARKEAQAARKDDDSAREKAAKEAADTARAAINNISIRMRDLNQQIADQQLAVLEAMEERMQALLDDINDDADRAISGFVGKRGHKRAGTEIRARIQTALGFVGNLEDLATEQMEIMEDQQKRLRRLLARARARGNRELAREIESQIADLRASIVEASAQIISDAQDRIQTAADHRQAGIDITNRIADVYSTFGQNRQAEQVRRGALFAQRASVTTQLDETRALLASAIKQGFGPEVLNPLREAVSDLETQLVENAAAMYQNTIALRQASIDAITNRQSFLGGVTDALKGITETMGGLTGTINTPQLVQIVTAAMASLTATGGGLRQQLGAFMGDFIGTISPQALSALAALTDPSLHGEDFVNAAMALPLNDIINQLGGPDSPLAQQFEALLQAIIDNESALQDNTAELQSIQQQNNIQQFTSTAWQWFRQAMFTGMGGLMPNLAEGTPFFAEGGDMQYDGLAYLHSGETVVPARFAQYVKQLMSAGQWAGRMSTGGIPAADLAMGFATGQAATIGGTMAGQFNGSNSEYAKLREALLHQQQHIETHIHGEPARDARHVTDTIAFKSKIPV